MVGTLVFTQKAHIQKVEKIRYGKSHLLAGSVTNMEAKTPKGASGAQREEKGLLPSHIAPGQTLFFVGVCLCCGDKYLSNPTAKQCGNKTDHNEAGKGLKPLTMDRKALSAKGEKAGEAKKP